MAETPAVILRSAEIYRLIDAMDLDGLRALYADDARGVDEVSRGWIRGRDALTAFWDDAFPRLSEIHSTVTEAEIHRWGDVQVETFMLHQTYVLDGTRHDIDAPTTCVWHREGGAWKTALVHSIPLSTEP